MARACVRETWQQYSFESEGHGVETRTDSAGRVVFPERRVRASLLRRTLGPLSKLPNVHAGYGVHAWVFAWAPGLKGMALYDGGDTLPGQVVLGRDPSGFHERADGRCSPPDLGAPSSAQVP